jgi:hypothetical protein
MSLDVRTEFAGERSLFEDECFLKGRIIGIEIKLIREEMRSGLIMHEESVKVVANFT